MDELNDIIPEFIIESSELLQSVERGLLRLEDGEDHGEAIHAVFRSIHSIKAGAGLMGLIKIERLARKMEGVLDLCRKDDLEPTQPVVDALLQSLDVLSSLFNRIDEHDSIDIEESIRALEAVLNAQLDPSLMDGLLSVDCSALPHGGPDLGVSRYSLKNKLDQSKVYFVHLELAQIEESGLSPLQLINEMLSMGEILGCKPTLPSVDLGFDQDLPVSFDLLFSTALESDQLQSALPLAEGNLHLLEEDNFGFHDELKTAKEETILPVAEQDTPPPEPRSAPIPAQEQAASPALQTQAERPTVEQAEDESSVEYLTFALGDESYGVDILSVQEIITIPHLTKLPRSPEHVLGVMNLRGMVVPVMDMRIRMNLPTETEIEPVVVVLNVGGRYMGAVVDSVSDVVVFQESDVQDPPEFAGAVHREYLRGLGRHDEEMIILLELDRILSMEAQSSAL